MTRTALGDAFMLNPKVTVPRGKVVPFVGMDAILPFTRTVSRAVEKPYSGGMKFADGDVLMARITPSLENGKTSIYRAADLDQPLAAGSTEFIVIRGREGISDSTFAYYLFTSDDVRRFAIGQMNGSSGRQRVQQDALASYVVDLPPLSEQLEIAATLGAIDDKIESNQRKRLILRSLGQSQLRSALDREPHSTVLLGDVSLSISRGVAPKYADDDPSASLVLSQKCIRGGWVTTTQARRMVDRPVAEAKRADSGDVLVNSTGTGTLGRVGRWHQGLVFVDGHVSVVKVDQSKADPTVVAYALFGRESDIEEMATGSTGQTELSPARLASLAMALPELSVSAELEKILIAIENRIDSLRVEDEQLIGLRNSVLPDLLSGRVRVSSAADAGLGA